MSGLLNEIKLAAIKKNSINRIVEQLNETDAKEFVVALNDHTITARAIVAVMVKRGFKLNDVTVSNYRRGVYGEPLK